VKENHVVVVALLGACVFGTPDPRLRTQLRKPSTAAWPEALKPFRTADGAAAQGHPLDQEALIAANLTLTDGEATTFWPRTSSTPWNSERSITPERR